MQMTFSLKRRSTVYSQSCDSLTESPHENRDSVIEKRERPDRKARVWAAQAAYTLVDYSFIPTFTLKNR